MLDHVWSLNPRAYQRLALLGPKAAILMLLVAGALTTASVGWFNRRRWAWSLAVAILAIQIAGDFVNFYLGHVIEGAIGITAAGTLLFYLLRPPVRAAFRI